jgi:hypothetical protein
VAPVAQLVAIQDRIHRITTLVHSAYTGKETIGCRCNRGSLVHCMRIVAILTFNMHGCDKFILTCIMVKIITVDVM